MYGINDQSQYTHAISSQKTPGREEMKINCLCDETNQIRDQFLSRIKRDLNMYGIKAYIHAISSRKTFGGE